MILSYFEMRISLIKDKMLFVSFYSVFDRVDQFSCIHKQIFEQTWLIIVRMIANENCFQRQIYKSWDNKNTFTHKRLFEQKSKWNVQNTLRVH